MNWVECVCEIGRGSSNGLASLPSLPPPLPFCFLLCCLALLHFYFVFVFVFFFLCVLILQQLRIGGCAGELCEGWRGRVRALRVSAAGAALPHDPRLRRAAAPGPPRRALGRARERRGNYGGWVRRGRGSGVKVTL